MRRGAPTYVVAETSGGEFGYQADRTRMKSYGNLNRWSDQNPEYLIRTRIINRIADQHDCDAVFVAGETETVDYILVPGGDVNLE